MYKYTCGICKKVKDSIEEIPELTGDEIFLCPSCEEVIHRLTGIVVSDEVKNG
jgi:predicted SprT family Zn-dependent metalloprotease